MSQSHAEWRILRELAVQPLDTPTLRARLSLSPRLTASFLTVRLSRLRSWGWLTGERSTGMGLPRVVSIYSITKAGKRALVEAEQRGYAVEPMDLERELAAAVENDPAVARELLKQG